MPLHPLILALIVVCSLCAPAAAAPPDPLTQGPLGAENLAYNEGNVLVKNADGVSYPAQLRGEVTVPVGAKGPFGVVVLQHGNHATCRVDGVELPVSPCPEFADPTGTTGPNEPLPNFRGYRYLTRYLASHGYISVSLDVNYVNTFGNGDQSTGMRERAELISRTLERMGRWNTTPQQGAIGSRLVGRVDLSRIGMVGHSRGGEGVTRFIQYNRDKEDGRFFPGLKAVLSYAGTDYATNVPYGVNYGVYAPRCDGDVYDVQSLFAWDRGRFTDPSEPGARVAFNVNGTNHNFGNQEWFSDDYGTGVDTACDPDLATNIRLSRPEQEENTIALVGAFLRRYVGPEPALDPYMTGEALLSGAACPTRVGCAGLYSVSYLAPAALRRMLITPAATDGARLTTSGFTTASACQPRHSTADGDRRDPGTASGCPSPRTRSRAGQLTLAWDGPAVLRAEPADRDLSRYAALTMRTGVNFLDPRNPPWPGGQDFDVVLVDAAGRSASVRAARGSSALTTPAGSDGRNRALLLGGVRLDLRAFTGVDLRNVAAVELRMGSRTPAGSIQLAELAVQGAAPSASPAARKGPGRARR